MTLSVDVYWLLWRLTQHGLEPRSDQSSEQTERARKHVEWGQGGNDGTAV